eukprot:GHVL01031216.1.p2 GENE.GHVL01031216.1~~GHVL01031216.1.p2  ORF type:complete len:749 (-),score=168.38 GHVL01031216.1:2859-5105(-)
MESANAQIVNLEDANSMLKAEIWDKNKNMIKSQKEFDSKLETSQKQVKTLEESLQQEKKARVERDDANLNVIRELEEKNDSLVQRHEEEIRNLQNEIDIAAQRIAGADAQIDKIEMSKKSVEEQLVDLAQQLNDATRDNEQLNKFLQIAQKQEQERDAELLDERRARSSENASNQKIINSLNSAKENLERKIERQELLVGKLQNDVKSLKTDAEDYKKKSDSIQKENEQLKQQLKLAQEDLKTLETNLNNEKHCHAQADEANQRVIQAMEDETENQKNRHNLELNILKKEAVTAAQQIEDISTKLSELESAKALLDGDFANMGQLLSEANKDNDHLKRQLEIVKEQAQNLDEELKGERRARNNENAANQKTKRALDGERDGLRQNIQRQEALITNLKEQVADDANKLNISASKVCQLEEEIKNLRTEAWENSRRQNEIDNAIEQAKRQLLHTQQQAVNIEEDLRNERGARFDENAANQNTIDALEAERQDIRQNNQRQESLILKLRQDVIESAQRLEDMKEQFNGEKNSLVDEINLQDDQLSRMEKEMNESQKQIEVHASELERVMKMVHIGRDEAEEIRRNLQTEEAARLHAEFNVENLQTELANLESVLLKEAEERQAFAKHVHVNSKNWESQRDHLLNEINKQDDHVALLKNDLYKVESASDSVCQDLKYQVDDLTTQLAAANEQLAAMELRMSRFQKNDMVMRKPSPDSTEVGELSYISTLCPDSRSPTSFDSPSFSVRSDARF